MVGEVDFVEIRDPKPGELAPGRSELKVATDSQGSRWVVRRGPGEAFAFALSERYFGKVVPRTVMIRQYGTAQELVSDSVTAHGADWSLVQLVRPMETFLNGLAGMACLDFVIRNRDRHANNWGLSADGRVWAFDNEASGEGLTLRQCLRPVYRCVLADDPDLSPALIDTMEHMLSMFIRDNNAPRVEAALADLAQWRSDLSGYRGV